MTTQPEAFVPVKREVLELVIEKAEATTKHFNIERIGESTFKDVNTRYELHEAVNKLRAALEQPGVEPVFLVATGETHNGEETYTRHDGCPPPLCDFETLYTAPQPAQQPEADKLLRQALEAFEAFDGCGDIVTWKKQWGLFHGAITAIRKYFGEKCETKPSYTK